MENMVNVYIIHWAAIIIPFTYALIMLEQANEIWNNKNK